MPKQSINHLNTIMYKIVCKDTEITDCYVGKTTDFTRRKALHKFSCNTPINKSYEYNVYECIRANKGWDNWDMIQIEKYEAVDMLDSRARERYWIETLKATLNQVIPTRTMQEWGKEYYQINKDIILEYHQKYQQENKEKIKKYQQEYKQENKEKIKKYQQEYYQKKKSN